MLKKLKPFQVIGSHFLQSRSHALLADEPGLGKTVQAIHAAEALNFRRILVVCPASVRTNWYQEVHDCGAEGIWLAISYEQACKYDAGAFEYYDGLILDEAHYLKTSESKRTQAIFGKNGIARARDLRAIWTLTGSPVLNRPRELWPILKCLHPGFSSVSWNSYAQRYCGAYFNGREIDTRGASNLPELNGLLDGFMLRRRKEDVTEQLPKKIVTRVALTLCAASQEILDGEERQILNREAKLSAAAEDFSALGDMAHLLHATGLAKVSEVVDFVLDQLETEEKVVVFFRHRRVANEIQTALGRHNISAVIYQGGMTDREKDIAIYSFKTNPECRVFLGQIQAAGTGINGLQDVSSCVVFAELSWVPGEMSQAIDRLHRMGQKASVVNAYLLHAVGSLESAVLGVQNAKGSVVGKLMGEDGWKT